MSDLYVVLLVAAISWIGLFLYLLRLDLRIKKLEQEK